MGRILRYLLLLGGPVFGIMLFLLVAASDNSASFEKNYPWLLGLNALFTGTLLIAVISLVVRLYRNFKQRKFGSRLTARLVLLFALIGILPGAIIYLVSVQFVSHSIESWFDVSVESALESGLNLGRAALDSQLNDLLAKGRSIALEISDLSDAGQTAQLAKLRDANLTQEASIVTASGRVIASVGGKINSLLPDFPTPLMLKQARMTRGYSALESVDHTGGTASDGASDLQLRVIIAIPSSSNELSVQGDTRFLQLLQPVSAKLATNAKALSEVAREYHERSLGRTGLRKIYIETLTLTMLLAIFCAVTAGFLIATNLAEPLLLLAEGTKAVAEGNLSPRPIVATTDELGTLTQSFNTMTKQLFDARASVEQNRTALENAKAYLESVLANMSAGVMVMDSQFILVSCNESVERILQHPIERFLGEPLLSIAELQAFSAAVMQAFSEQSAQSAADAGHTRLHWQHQIEIPRAHGVEDIDNKITLLARGSRLPVANGSGYLVVFDDISDVISAQRSFAWGEVARRLAHEIKNPLTPIQLSAERLQMKLAAGLSPQDSAILNKCTSTIVNQVAAMKRMVDDFREYAKTPPAVLSPLNLNALIDEILHLYLSGDDRDIIRATLAPDLPRVMGDATQLRQVIHNLLQNAQDAVSDRVDHLHDARIDLATEEIHYTGTNGELCAAVRISITDNGPGFGPKILARAFEPYVTSKPRGTGLGLAMVKKIIDEHGGRIDIQNRPDANGAKVSILLLKLAPIE